MIAARHGVCRREGIRKTEFGPIDPDIEGEQDNVFRWYAAPARDEKGPEFLGCRSPGRAVMFWTGQDEGDLGKRSFRGRDLR